ncbi:MULTISPECIES: KGG domain-containing protein [unclassified Duganella]|uniref:KGG domain-containing protein n=1 Tax=unclassified Duganella TaxID=2636909 RepID=UPI0006F78E2F|nr:MULTISPECIES: KGG domain-containing protein [unclassified Duganella]KQV46171.1 stress-induced protein [Duganella sp. Root336D2]KRB81816.1 stress-induced protein [Duganella sp. Root198D2]
MASSNQDNRGGSKQSGNQGGNRQSGDTSNRGFASMDPERQREIASEGGKAAHASGNAHEFTSEEARKAGSMSHKNDGNRQSGSDSGGGSRQSGGGSGGSGGSGGGTRGGTPEQHAEAGRQSHKNDDKR